MWIVDLLTGGLVDKLTGSLERAYAAKLAAQTNEEKLEADKQIAFFQGQIQLATVAAQNDRWWSFRSLVGYGVAFVVLKLLVWDTGLQWGSTPYPGTLVTGIILTVVGFNFGSKAVSDAGARLLAMFSRR